MPVVVRCGLVTRAVAFAVWVAVLVEFLLMGAQAWLMGPAMVYAFSPLLLVQCGFMVVMLREHQSLLGPQLAADASGLWVRTGVGRRPTLVYLPWSAVEAIDVTRGGHALRIVSQQGEGLYVKRTPWRVRRLRRRYGTSFAIERRQSAAPVVQLYAMLTAVGGPQAVVVRSPLPPLIRTRPGWRRLR